MKKDTTATLLWGLGVGAGLMYLFDPDRGKRRRALVRDKAQALTRRLQKTVDKTSRDLRNRVQGLALEAKSHNVPDEVLVERVRSKLGRLVSHPHAIEVAAKNGVVTLSGPVLADEVRGLLSGVSGVPGVSRIENRVHVHEEAAGVPGLQGNPRRRARFEFMKTDWTPAARLTASVVGSAVNSLGLVRRDPQGVAVSPTNKPSFGFFFRNPVP